MTIIDFMIKKTMSQWTTDMTESIEHCRDLDDADGLVGVVEVVEVETHDGIVVLGSLVCSNGLDKGAVTLLGLRVLGVELGRMHGLEKLTGLQREG